jgi:hypothetical protein
MRTNRTVRRNRQTAQHRAPTRSDITRIPAGTPRCVNCGRPLLHLPLFLHSTQGAARGFQCQRCFYANTMVAAPHENGLIASEQTRWLSELVHEGVEGVPRRRADGE